MNEDGGGEYMRGKRFCSVAKPIHSEGECQFSIPSSTPTCMWVQGQDLCWIYMFCSHVWQTTWRQSEDETEIKWEEEEEEIYLVSFLGLTLISSAEGRHRQEPSGKRMCESPAFQRKASGIINCFVTRRCRVKGFYPVVLTFNPFCQYVKNSWHALFLNCQ